jgi:GNAT superfamily N-acetyltransferase
MDIRVIDECDYDDILIGWWKDWGWDAPTKDFLPNNGTGGLIVSHEGTPICAGFIYNTNSKVCWVDWIISNKDYRGDDRGEAISLLIAALTQSATAMGAKYIYALIKNQSLIETYQAFGFTKGDSYVGEMIKII